MAAPTVPGVIDTSGIARMHPLREGRRPQQIGRNGLSNQRWSGGGTFCLWLHPYGLVVGWDYATAHSADNTFHWLMRHVDGRRRVLSDTGFHAAAGDPATLTRYQRGEWQDRILVETVLAMLTVVCHFQTVTHRVWAYGHARLACTMAAFQGRVQWHGLRPTACGCVPLAIAAFGLSKTPIMVSFASL